MQTYTTIQAWIEIDNHTPLNQADVREAQRRLEMAAPTGQAFDPEPIDAANGIWNIWVPTPFSMELVRYGNLDYHNDLPNQVAAMHADMP